MKKRFTWKKITVLGIVAVTIGIFILVASLSGGRESAVYKIAMRNLAEARFYMMQAQNENVRIQFFSGMREEPYTIDGVANPTVPFALINVEPRNASHHDDDILEGTLRIGEENIEVKLERNQFGRNFATDIGRLVEPGTPIQFILRHNNDTVIFNLVPSMRENAIGWEEALRIASKHFERELRSAQNFASYIKIITDHANISAFWFVQFVTTAQEVHFVVIGQDGTLIGT